MHSYVYSYTYICRCTNKGDTACNDRKDDQSCSISPKTGTACAWDTKETRLFTSKCKAVKDVACDRRSGTSCANDGSCRYYEKMCQSTTNLPCNMLNTVTECIYRTILKADCIWNAFTLKCVTFNEAPCKAIQTDPKLVSICMCLSVYICMYVCVHACAYLCLCVSGYILQVCVRPYSQAEL